MQLHRCSGLDAIAYALSLRCNRSNAVSTTLWIFPAPRLLLLLPPPVQLRLLVFSWPISVVHPLSITTFVKRDACLCLYCKLCPDTVRGLKHMRHFTCACWVDEYPYTSFSSFAFLPNIDNQKRSFRRKWSTELQKILKPTRAEKYSGISVDFGLRIRGFKPVVIMLVTC